LLDDSAGESLLCEFGVRPGVCVINEEQRGVEMKVTIVVSF